MTTEFMSRMVGLVVFLFLGIRLGLESSGFVGLPATSTAFVFGLVGVLVGLILTPYLTVHPIRTIRRSINEWPIELLLMSLTGALIGLLLALLATYPLSLLPPPFGNFVPPILMLVFAYLGMTIFGVRSKEIAGAIGQRLGKQGGRLTGLSSRKLILDTSVLIDGRITDIAETGFVGGTMIIPRFVLSELHRVADSSDHLRRNRGRRGLNMLNKLQKNEVIPIRIVEDDFDDISAVDDKLVALALQMTAVIITNDYNLNQVAEAQGVTVLNINQLANAVRSIYIPGESFALRIIQEGREHEQGVGYLEDGTMVVVERGNRYMDRTINVEVTKLINQPTGRMIFAVPAGDRDR
ncbi:MAG: PIN domain-containing protein [Anaerolineae bacterium]|nr:PIN domain-containing protein [Anaerolineae bacterium]MDQ7033542.1 PIN domain-containing protein [Anaerolineae bacterium]